MPTPHITILAPTPRGNALALLLQSGISHAEILNPEVKLSEALPEVWARSDRLIFILAVGAVVRLIAPLLTTKQRDPGVVVVDEAGTVAISLSGGHVGGGDALARQVAALLDATAVITSASEGQHLPAIDLLGEPYGWRRGAGDWLAVAKAATQQQPVEVVQTCGWTLWQNTLPANHSFCFERESATIATSTATLWISDRLPPSSDRSVACWHPRTLWIGIGCERGTEMDLMAEALQQVLQTAGLAPEAIAGIASIDLKQDEGGLQALARTYDVPIRFYTSAELTTVPVPNPSEVVAQAVGTPSVAEAAALLASDRGTLLVAKQVHRGDRGACTVAVARARTEYTPRQGKLYLVGMGPGSLAQMTPAARAAVTQCDAIVGYQLYLDLIQPLLHPGQCVESSPITQEVQRAERAIALAQRGLQVAVVSSGDCGIYGMAGLVLECLATQGWDGCTPAVEVLPGITALQAIAARVGAPLMHDFCAISLSDLLAPWEVIEKRLEAAARADFAVALYNPRSKTRTQGIEIALEIFARWRSPETPVAIGRSLYRPDEEVRVTTLAEVDTSTIDMLTVVLIGNASTFQYQSNMVAPRGYRVAQRTESPPKR